MVSAERRAVRLGYAGSQSGETEQIGGACMIDSKGNVRPEGMFDRVIVVGDVLKRLVKQECPQRLPKECPKLPAEKERP